MKVDHTLVLLLLPLTACEQFKNEQVASEDDFSGFSIVKEEYLYCYSSQAHYTGMEIVFTRQTEDGVISWLADGLPVGNQKLSASLVSGSARYTEYETGRNEQYTVVDAPYTFRLDYVKGTLDIWLAERYGEKAPPDKTWHFTASCEQYEPPMN